MTTEHRVGNASPVFPCRPVHQWRVETFCLCHERATTLYEGTNYIVMIRRVGEGCLANDVDVVFVFRDNVLIREIDVGCPEERKHAEVTTASLGGSDE